MNRISSTLLYWVIVFGTSVQPYPSGRFANGHVSLAGRTQCKPRSVLLQKPITSIQVRGKSDRTLQVKVDKSPQDFWNQVEAL